MLEGLEGCVNILDDIVVFAVDMEEHDKRLRLVLNRLQKYGATVRVDKCAIGVPEVEFNGHLLSAAGDPPSHFERGSDSATSSSRKPASVVTFSLYGDLLYEVLSWFRRTLRAFTSFTQSRRGVGVVRGLSASVSGCKRQTRK
jgi:hypothetical protein